jgi:hypothetical protein
MKSWLRLTLVTVTVGGGKTVNDPAQIAEEMKLVLEALL